MRLEFVGEIRKDNTIKLPAFQRRALSFEPGQIVYVTIIKLSNNKEERQNQVRNKLERG